MLKIYKFCKVYSLDLVYGYGNILRHLATTSDITDVSILNGNNKTFLQMKKNIVDGGKIHVENGLPIINIQLPSRKEDCQFVLRPVSDSVGSFCDALLNEDSGIEVVTFYSPDGLRISKSTRIQHLLRFQSFYIRINDTYHHFNLQSFDPSTGEKLTSIEELKSKSSFLVASLYTVMNVDEFKLKKEHLVMEHIECIERELRPLRIVRMAIDKECENFVHRVFWAGFSAICFQVGIFARLTWWEYSWDIMEPITYFSTFSTVVIALSYYIMTKQNFEYSTAQSRILSQDFHRRADKYKFDIKRFNELQDLKNDLNAELAKLKYPLQNNTMN